MNGILLHWALKSLGSTSVEARLRAVAKLTKSPDPRAVKPLVGLLRDQDRDVRSAAAEALGGIGDGWAARALVETILTDSSSHVRYEAIEALKRISDPRAVNGLMVILEDENHDTAMRQVAARALKAIGGARLSDTHRAMIAIICDEWSEAVELGFAAAPPLTQALRTGTHRVRREAAQGLGKIGDARAVDALFGVMTDPSQDDEVQHMAAWALEKFAWVTLDDGQRAYVAVALENWSAALGLGTAAISPLVSMLRSGTERIRENAVSALSKLPGDRVLETLAPLLADRDKRVRRSAVQVLGSFKSPDATMTLVAALDNDEWGVREAAALALDDRGWRPVDQFQLAVMLVAQRKWSDAVRLGPAAVGPLVAALKEPAVRWKAARAMTQMGKLAVEPLIATLKDESAVLRVCAAEALADIGDRRAAERLTELLDDEEIAVRRAALGALEKLGWKPDENAERVDAAIKCEEWWRLTTLGEAAVEPLIEATKDALLADRAVAALEQVLQSGAAGRIPPEHLRRLAALGRSRRRPPAASTAGPKTTALAEIDYTTVRRLAEKELKRRGGS